MKRDLPSSGAGAAPFAVPPHWLHGAHLARVTDVADPLGLGRVKLALFNAPDAPDGTPAEVWARVAAPFAGSGRGAFLLPQPDDEVLVVFVGGDARAPVIVGGLWNGGAPPPEQLDGSVDRWSFTGKSGTRIAMVETGGGSRIELATAGGVRLTLSDAEGGRVELECNGNRMTVSPQGIAFEALAKFSASAPQAEVSAAMVKVDAAMSTFSGVVKSDVLQTSSVVSASYTPGAGNVW